MQETTPGNKRKYSLLKLLGFGICSFALVLGIASFLFLWPIVGHYFFPSEARKGLSQAIKIWNEGDRSKAEPIMKDAIKSAEEAHAPVAELMQMHRTYAQFLYQSNDWAAADAQISAAIALCPQPPKADSADADQLTHAYQDRGWEAFQRHLKDPSLPAGDLDQEHSVEVAEKAFGPEHEQTIYKIPSLALIYGSMGLKDKADKTMQRAIDAVGSKASARECGWFVYGSDARLKASEHEYKPALASLLHALELAGKNKKQAERVWNDFCSELERATKHDKYPQLRNVASMFNQEKFAELDQLADKLQKAKTATANADWELDVFYDRMLSSDNMTDRDYQQRLFEVKTWMKKYPKSIAARVAMAKTYVDYAWFARGHGYSNEVDEQGWKNFNSRLAQAKAALDADPDLKGKTPLAYDKYAGIAQGQGMEKPKYKELLDQCHKAWPSYHSIDAGACYFYLPRWYGEPNEVETFIQARADAVGAAKGDELYAQLVWRCWQYLDNLFSPSSPLKWTRVRSGFMQIFADYPDDMDARIAFIKLCAAARDTESLKTAFDRYHAP